MIIFLQETHSSINDETFWKNQWGEHAWFSSYSSNSRGVAILIRNPIAPVVQSLYSDPNGRFLIILISFNGLSLLLVNVYAPNNDDPDFFLELFAKIDQFNYTSLIVGGDFNAVLGPLDYQGSRSKHCNVKASEMISLLMENSIFLMFGDIFILVYGNIPGTRINQGFYQDWILFSFLMI